MNAADVKGTTMKEQLQQWQEVHDKLVEAIVIGREGVAAQKAQKRFWLEQFKLHLDSWRSRRQPPKPAKRKRKDSLPTKPDAKKKVKKEPKPPTKRQSKKTHKEKKEPEVVEMPQDSEPGIKDPPDPSLDPEEQEFSVAPPPQLAVQQLPQSRSHPPIDPESTVPSTASVSSTNIKRTTPPLMYRPDYYSSGYDPHRYGAVPPHHSRDAPTSTARMHMMGSSVAFAGAPGSGGPSSTPASSLHYGMMHGASGGNPHHPHHLPPYYHHHHPSHHQAHVRAFLQHQPHRYPPHPQRRSNHAPYPPSIHDARIHEETSSDKEEDQAQQDDDQPPRF